MIIRIKTKTNKAVGGPTRPRGFTMLEVPKPEDMTVAEVVAELAAKKPEDIKGLPEDLPAEAFLQEVKQGHFKVSMYSETEAPAKKAPAKKKKVAKKKSAKK